jgi:hypothetical protein
MKNQLRTTLLPRPLSDVLMVVVERALAGACSPHEPVAHATSAMARPVFHGVATLAQAGELLRRPPASPFVALALRWW